MKKKISKRRLKIINIKKHEEILKQLSTEYSVKDKCYGDGYFVFTFDANSICWFYLNEFPDWKFAIWLNEDGSYDIFGEAIVQIDKFKPSRSSLSYDNIKDFNLELVDVKNNIGEWEEYNQDTKEMIILNAKCDKISAENLNKIESFLKEQKELCDKEEVGSFLELKDRNTEHFTSSPRYKLTQFTYKDNYFETDEAKKRSIKLFDELSSLLQYKGNQHPDHTYEDDYIDVDSFIFLHREILHPDDFRESEKNYGRDNDYEKMLAGLRE